MNIIVQQVANPVSALLPDLISKGQMNETDQLNIVRNLFFTGEDLLLDSRG